MATTVHISASASTKRPTEPHIHFFAGGIAGLVSCLVLQPLDVVKTRLQQERQPHPSASSVSGSTTSTLHRPWFSLNRLYSVAIFSKARQIVVQESVWTLWRGTLATMLRAAPGSAIYMTSLTEVRKLLKHGFQEDRLMGITMNDGTINMVSGALTRSIGLVMMPVSVVKSRYESDLYNYKSLWEAFTSIRKTEGIRGLFNGFTATALRDAPYAGLYLLFYENSKAMLKAARLPFLQESVSINFTSATSSSIVATLLTQPFDVIKTRMQIKPHLYKSTTQSIALIMKEEGLLGLFSGLSPRLVRKACSAAITWTLYEELVKIGRKLYT
ncbi:mitochondrial carrier domain-containing protein [Polychytrium aggregatum]|uniref:mitochondrial carrier domain-containing protein n=1 Tax=Polychytrium aggregatum TaxID=110093 RepID=UPI0022FDF688|nr:mitochondrial carrier domain-containing protein [Polychytrium aggregatum]KAI9193609.1 mitochondrial carrier domain-containing protein [Polychytrium aggregatum]